jgi:SNF family Na+-dependent transporter
MALAMAMRPAQFAICLLCSNFRLLRLFGPDSTTTLIIMTSSTEAVVHGLRDSKREDSDIWSSRSAFYFAAIGAAVGFGNVWRFPALSVEYGGGAFFIPYFMAFFIIGIPILVLEIGFGQFWQTGDVGVFGGFNSRLRGVGVASVACGWMLVIYYSILITWVIKAFFDAFGDVAPWADEGVTGQIAIDYFMAEIIGTSTLGEDGTATRIVWANVGYLALTWLIIWAGIAFGSKITGRIAYMTMGIPIIVLFIFLFTAIGLEGASDGIKVYIGKWDMSVLTEQGDVWSQATTQIFFSIGVTFGIMTAFGSHCKRHEPAFLNSVVIATANSTFSVISGFAVFAALGHLAFLEGVPVEDLSYGGFSLVFGTWPVVVGTLPGGIHWVRLLFFDLFLLGIDSAFGFMEGIITVASDTPQFMNTPKWKVTGCFCLLSFLFSLMYATDAGLNWLNVVDYYINFVMILVGLFETLGAGWVYGIHDQLESVGYKAGTYYYSTCYTPTATSAGQQCYC